MNSLLDEGKLRATKSSCGLSLITTYLSSKTHKTTEKVERNQAKYLIEEYTLITEFNEHCSFLFLARNIIS